MQGQGLAEKITCTFSNSSYTVTVNATVESSSRASCASPAWRIATGDGRAPVQLAVQTGRCVQYLQYTYLVDPLVVKVEPARIPRYGAVPLRIRLEDPIPSLSPEQACPSSSSPLYLSISKLPLYPSIFPLYLYLSIFPLYLSTSIVPLYLYLSMFPLYLYLSMFPLYLYLSILPLYLSIFPLYLYLFISIFPLNLLPLYLPRQSQ